MRLNDLEFHVEIDGHQHSPPLLLLHGFTGSVRAWDEVRPLLANDWRVISIDLIGHGQSSSPRDGGRYTLEWASRDLLALLDALKVRALDILGYSMGGRVALYFALHAPSRVKTLILESASAGIQDDAERQRRSEADAALAERIERNGIAEFVDEWERQPLLDLAPHVTAEVRERQHLQRLKNVAVGLAHSLRGMGAGQQEALWSRLPELLVPVGLIVGERDARYCEIARCMQSMLPNADLSVVDDAGHTVHVDQPQKFVTLVGKVIDNKLTHRATRC
jgi:2-succinyl-6-hydroxy-2,4-cyclohexadiene-1-carboxylate synthase